MIGRKTLGGPSDASALGVSTTMACSTQIIRVQEQPDRGRTAVMFFGRPGYYYARDREMIDRLKKSFADGTPVQVEWNPTSMEILRVTDRS